MKKGRQGAPTLLLGVSLRTQIQWFLFDQGWDQGTENHRWNVRFKIGSFVLKPKTAIASLTHWYSYPWRHQNSKCQPGATYLRSILAHTQTSPRLSREPSMSYVPTAQHLTSFWERQPHTDTARTLSNAATSAFWGGTAEGSSSIEFLCKIGISMKP